MEESNSHGIGRVFWTPELGPDCPLRWRGARGRGGHPRGAGQVSAACGVASPIGLEGDREAGARVRGWSHLAH